MRNTSVSKHSDREISILSLDVSEWFFVSLRSCRQRGWLARRLSYVLFVMERDVNKDMFTRNIVDNVLNNKK